MTRKPLPNDQPGRQSTPEAASGHENQPGLPKKNDPFIPKDFETINDSFFILKIIRNENGEAVDLEFVEANDAVVQYSGFQRGQVIGQRCREIFPQVGPAWVERLASVANTDKGILQEHWEFICGEMRYLKLRCFSAGPDLVAVMSADLTGEVLARQQLHESEQRYRLIAHHLEDIIWQMDAGLNFTYVNPAVERIFGYTVEEACRLNVKTMLEDAGIRQMKRAVHNHLTSQTEPGLKATEYRMKHKDGHWIDVEVRSAPIKDDHGNLAGLVGVTRDITERKQMEKALHWSEADLADAQRIAKLGNWRFEISTGTVRWSEELYKVFDVEKSDFGGLYESFLNRVHPDDRPLVMGTNRKARETGKPFEIEYRIEPRNGQMKYIREIGYAQKDAGGKVASLFGAAQDITERRQAEEALRQSEARLQESNLLMAGILKHTPMMVVYLDPQFNFIWVNRAYAATCQHEPAFFPGKNHFDLYPHEENQAIFQRVVDTGRPFFATAKAFIFPDQPRRGTTYWDWSLVPVKDQKGKILGLVFTLAEVTNRIRTEKALQKNHERLQAHVKEIESLQQQLREQAIRDPLTGLFNRRYMNETLDREIARAGREAHPIGLIIMDIDHFKKVNDAYGHRAGDKMLKALGDLLKANSRAEDIPCRYGGEEFVVVMPGAPLEITCERAELIRTKFDMLRVPYGGQELHASMSLGVAVYPTHGHDSDAVLIRADRALYRAKQSGRNCVVFYQGTGEMSLPEK